MSIKRDTYNRRGAYVRAWTRRLVADAVVIIGAHA